MKMGGGINKTKYIIVERYVNGIKKYYVKTPDGQEVGPFVFKKEATLFAKAKRKK